MEIYNQEKTIKLNERELDFEVGYLQADKLLIKHNDAVIGKSIEQIVQELQAQGEICNLRKDGKWYKQTAVYENGGTEEEEVFPVEAINAYDEYQDVQIYVPYTEEELKERKLKELRMRREIECFPIINRGQLWYSTLSESQKNKLQEWYSAWLNVTKTLTIPEKPEWIK